MKYYILGDSIEDNLYDKELIVFSMEELKKEIDEDELKDGM